MSSSPGQSETPLLRQVADRESLPGPTALCLSGGGYRAMLFHVGVLWRLHEIGWLFRVDRISAVSGGSITAGLLASKWTDLVDATSTFEDAIVIPIRSLAGRTIDVGSVMKGFLPWKNVGREIETALRSELFCDTTLGELPEHPDFIFHATNVSTGKLVRFDRSRVSDWLIGSASSKDIRLASAVAASASFPPVLSPYRLDTSKLKWRKDGSGTLPDAADYRDELALTDGGVYDNLGLESVWSRSGTVLVSDGGGRLRTSPGAAGDWARHFVRTSQVLDHQVRSLRIRQVQAAFSNLEKAGTHIGIRTDPDEYDKPTGHLPVGAEDAKRIASTPTRLRRLSARDQEKIINWGYAVADIKMRTKVDPEALPPEAFPYAGGIG